MVKSWFQDFIQVIIYQRSEETLVQWSWIASSLNCSLLAVISGEECLVLVYTMLHQLSYQTKSVGGNNKQQQTVLK